MSWPVSALSSWSWHGFVAVALGLLSLGSVAGGCGNADIHRTPGTDVSYGVDVNPYDRDIGPERVPQVLSMAQRAGARAVRIGVGWAQVEIEPGAYRWAFVDRLFQLANGDHLQVLFELGNEPAWDAVGGNPNAPPADCARPDASCASVDSYVTALVRHARPFGLRYLILRNEPQNFARNWVGGTAASYARFEQVAYAAAHRADPAIKVLNGGTQILPPMLQDLGARLGLRTPYSLQAERFVESLYSDPAWCDSIDVLDVHVGDHGPRWSSQIVNLSEAAATRCREGRSVPVWVTEVGYSSIPQLQASPVYQLELDGRYRGGPAGQARFLLDTFHALASDPAVVGIDWTFLIDPNETGQVLNNLSYRQALSEGVGDGLMTAAYVPKASYGAFREVARGNE
jgi:hypothetical protein